MAHRNREVVIFITNLVRGNDDMSVRASSDEIGPKLIEALGLPKNIKRLELVFEAGKQVSVVCEVLTLDVDFGVGEFIAELTEYELRKIERPGNDL